MEMNDMISTFLENGYNRIFINTDVIKPKLESAALNCKIAKIVFAVFAATSLLSFHPINAAVYFGATYLMHEFETIFYSAEHMIPDSEKTTRNIHPYSHTFLNGTPVVRGLVTASDAIIDRVVGSIFGRRND
jgi:hypothetical protein